MPPDNNVPSPVSEDVRIIAAALTEKVDKNTHRNLETVFAKHREKKHAIRKNRQAKFGFRYKPTKR